MIPKSYKTLRLFWNYMLVVEEKVDYGVDSHITSHALTEAKIIVSNTESEPLTIQHHPVRSHVHPLGIHCPSPTLLGHANDNLVSSRTSG